MRHSRSRFSGRLRALQTVLVVLAFTGGSTRGVERQLPLPDPFAKPPTMSFRVLSWNVSQENFFRHAEAARSLLRWIDPDLLLLDEIPGNRSAADVLSMLRGLRGDRDSEWNVVVGASGGYQRAVVATRFGAERVPELDVLRYPESVVARLKTLVPESNWIARVQGSLEAGIPTVGAVVRIGDRSLLAVSVDLQCCSSTNDWQEMRRQVEAREIRGAVGEVLQKRRVDGVLLAGDFNLVGGGTPLVILSNPYPAPHHALVPADAVHLDGAEVWTWDGRGTEFPSRPIDFSLYGPGSLAVERAVVVSTEDIDPAVLEAKGLKSGTSRELSDHLPIVVDYRWRDGTATRR